MGTEYVPVFIFLVVAILVAASMLIASAVLGPRKTTGVKQMPYESGMDPIGDARQRFDVRYYLVAIVFLLFDVELLFLYPWAVAQWSAGPRLVAPTPGAAVDVAGLPAEIRGIDLTPKQLKMSAVAVTGLPAEFRGWVFGEVLLFIVILAAAFAYSWKKGVFEWR